jgi:PAS domain S-box-containing protein
VTHLRRHISVLHAKALVRGILWILAYLALAKAASATASEAGAAVWYPPAALTFVLFSRLGWRALPLALTARIAAAYVVYHSHSPIEVMLLNSLGSTAAYGLGARLVRRSCGNTLFDTRSSSVRFIFLGAMLTPFLAALGALVPPYLLLHRTFAAFETTLGRFWVGDACAMASVAPAILYLQSTGARRLRIPCTRRLLQHATLIVTTGVAIRSSLIGQWNTLYLSMLPVLWIASTAGVLGTANSLALLSLTITVVTQFGPYDAHGILEAQMLICVISGIGLVVASANTERHRTELRLQHSEQRFSDIVQSTNEWIWELDHAGRFSYTNAAAEAMTGLPPSALLGTRALALVHPEDFRSIAPMIKRLISTGAGWSRHTARVRHADGTFRWVEISAMPYRDPLSRTNGFRGSSRDVTARKLEEQFLRERCAAEEAVVQRLEEMDRQKEEFASSITHDLRTPLTSVIGYLEMLTDGDAGALGGGQQKLAEAAQRSAGHLLDMVRDLLTLTQIDVGTLQPCLTEVEADDLIQNAARVIYPLTNNRSIVLEVDVAAGTGCLPADRDQLDRMLMNMLGNAVKFTPDGGRIALRARRHHGFLQIVVADNGIGIDPADLPHLFDRFYRARTAQTRLTTGAGIGLAVVKGIVEAHGGDIRVDSAPGHGTTFLIRLPLASEPSRTISSTPPPRTTKAL